jgi:hypothetical protein
MQVSEKDMVVLLVWVGVWVVLGSKQLDRVGQLFRIHVDVSLGGADVGVPRQCSQLANADALVGQAGDEGSSSRMAARAVDAAGRIDFQKQLTHGVGTERRPLLCAEQGVSAFAVFHQHPVFGHGPAQGFVQVDRAFVPALGLGTTQDELLAHSASVVVNVAHEQTGDFFGTEASVEADQNDGAVAQGVAAGADVLQHTTQLRFGDGGGLGHSVFLLKPNAFAGFTVFPDVLDVGRNQNRISVQ